MNPFDFHVLADENIHKEVVSQLSQLGVKAVHVKELGLGGREDREILQLAHERGLVVLTQDSDFGRLAIQQGEPCIGIIYLRPGHIKPDFVVAMIRSIMAADLEVEPPFLIVAERKEDTIRVRARRIRE